MIQGERIIPDESIRIFFDRSVDEVSVNLGDAVYSRTNGVLEVTEGQGKILVVPSAEGEQEYRITAVEPFEWETAAPVWKGKRAQEIRGLFGGETITYRSRSGTLTFVKVQDADNILIRGLENLSTGEKLQNATQVSQTLGLSHRDMGRLTLVDENRFRFVRSV